VELLHIAAAAAAAVRILAVGHQEVCILGGQEVLPLHIPAVGLVVALLHIPVVEEEPHQDIPAVVPQDILVVALLDILEVVLLDILLAGVVSLLDRLRLGSLT